MNADRDACETPPCEGEGYSSVLGARHVAPVLLYSLSSAYLYTVHVIRACQKSITQPATCDKVQESEGPPAVFHSLSKGSIREKAQRKVSRLSSQSLGVSIPPFPVRTGSGQRACACPCLCVLVKAHTGRTPARQHALPTQPAWPAAGQPSCSQGGLSGKTKL